jgi:hypothetical protein
MLSALWPPLSHYSGARAVPRYDGSRRENEGSAMSHTKEASQRRRRTKAVRVLGAAGLSFSLATGASAAIINPDPAVSAPISQQVMVGIVGSAAILHRLPPSLGARGSGQRQKRALSLPFVPVRQLTVYHLAPASMSSAGIDRISGTCRRRGRPRLATGQSRRTSTGYTFR